MLVSKLVFYPYPDKDNGGTLYSGTLVVGFGVDPLCKGVEGNTSKLSPKFVIQTYTKSRGMCQQCVKT
jgi:hypothetical protein